MADMDKLQERAIRFREERNWKQFHTTKDLAISLTVEAVELLDQFKWLSDDEVARYTEDNQQKVADELMDVLYNVLLISHDLGIDIEKEYKRKMRENEQKYPVEKAKNSNKKYDNLS